jgi:hypothetical protein
VLLAGSASVGLWRAASTGLLLQDDDAFEPWEAWTRTPWGEPLSLLAAAILASSPHNTQPWLFTLKEGRIEVRADPRRSLGAMDPYGREMWQGIGAALANIEVAAPARGFTAETLLRPDAADEHLAARVQLGRSAQAPSALADAIAQRSTNRAAYDPHRLPPGALLDALSHEDTDEVRLLWLRADSEAGRAFAQATLDGTRQISADAEMAAAGHHWFRASPKALAAARDGISTRTSGIPPLVAQLSPLFPPVDAKTAGEYWLRSTRMHLESAPMYALILVRELYDRRSQLLAGARWQRAHLALTAQGLAAHPLNQLMEVVDRDRQLARPSPTAALLARLAGLPGWRPTFAFRTGFATRAVPRSARRELAAVVTASPPPTA